MTFVLLSTSIIDLQLSKSNNDNNKSIHPSAMGAAAWSFQLPNCFSPAAPSHGHANLVFWGTGHTRVLPAAKKGHQLLAGVVMAEFPNRVVCHAESFFIGRPVPALSIEDELLPGQTYFVLPVDRLPGHQPLTAASLASLSPGSNRPSLAGGKCPFEYVNGADGSIAIRVMPEFIAKTITSSSKEGGAGSEPQRTNSRSGVLCNTPELMKHYSQLVGPRGRPWSPKLETICECRKSSSSSLAGAAGRLSPVRLLGLQKKAKV